MTSVQLGYKIKEPKDPSEKSKKYFSIIDNRAWGWFKDLKTAKKCVKGNWGDLHELSYNYVVIEKFQEGILNQPREWWFKWKKSAEYGTFVPTKKPHQLEGVIGFGLG